MAVSLNEFAVGLLGVATIDYANTLYSNYCSKHFNKGTAKRPRLTALVIFIVIELCLIYETSHLMTVIKASSLG